ncbi:ferric-chelate reductase 1-like [Liolophura sinensis]|uniref:ferric-chelate reductase 1-like n=1 Tax=Liolophura sinensis TaxID=3198878 RepID=UPI0031596BC9
MATAEKDGKIYCRFSRPKSLASMKVEEEDDPSGPTEITIDLSSGKVIFIAVGKTYNGGNDLAEHVEAPVLSSGKVDFSQFKVARGTTMTLLTQLHGVAMVLAWMLFVSFATVEGRYFREGFGSKMVCGLKLWFQMHRVVTMIAGILTAAGFILIFVKVKGLSKNAQAHTYIGIIVMAATCGQIFLGLIRPDATAGWRPKFNWAHRLLGKATHILAAADLILAFRLPMVSPEMRHFGTTVVAVWISVQVVWEVTFEVNKYLQSKSPKVDSIPGKEETKIEEKVIWKDPNGRLQLILCILFVLTIVSCSVATLCAILIF